MRNSSRDHDPLQHALTQARWRPEQAKLIVDAWKARPIHLLKRPQFLTIVPKMARFNVLQKRPSH